MMELLYLVLFFPLSSSRHCCCVSVLFYCFYYVTRGIPGSRNLSQGKRPLRPFSVSPVIAPTVSLVYLCSPALLNNCPAPPSLTLASGGVPGGRGRWVPPPGFHKDFVGDPRGARCGFSNAQSRLNLLFRAHPQPRHPSCSSFPGYSR